MIKKTKINTNEIKIKLVIVCLLLAITVLSFFFAENLERFFGFSGRYLKNQVGMSKISDSSYEVDYLDVGQGNSAFIRLPDGKTAIIDGGDISYSAKIINKLESNKVQTIDYMIATHADSDHIGGLLAVLDKFDVKNIYRPFQISGRGESFETFQINESEDLADVYLNYVAETNNRSKISRVTSNIYAEFIDKIYCESYFEDGVKKFSKVTVFYDGLKILGDNYSFEFFAPFVRDDAVALDTITENTYGYATLGYGANESNESSAIFLFSCYGETFFFSGDASFTNESKNADKIQFLENDFLKSLSNEERDKLSKVSVLIVGHHGSKYSTSESLIKLLNPSFIVISVGENNEFGHPHIELLNRIDNIDNFESENLIRTDKCGDIKFSSINGSLKFAYSKFEENKRLTLSWIEFSLIIFIVVSYIVVFIKPKRNKQF